MSTSAPPRAARGRRECSGPRSSLVLLVLIHDLGVDHVVIVRRRGGLPGLVGRAIPLGLALRVDRGPDGLQGLDQRIALGIDVPGRLVLGCHGLLGVLDVVLALGLVRLGALVLVVLQQLLALVDELLEGVAGVGVLAALLVLGGVGLCVLVHLIN